jgi:CHAD domain-containing protein
MRSVLQVCRDAVDVRWAKRVRAELGWMGRKLGAVRDLDVLMARLTEEGSDFSGEDRAGVDAVLGVLAGERAAARRLLLRGLDSARYRRVLETVAAAVRDGVPAGDPELRAGAEVLVARPYRRLADAVDALDEDPPDAELHELRILGKRLRYAAELLDSRKAARLVKALGRFQDVLGDHQDAVVAADRLRDLALGTDLPPQGVFAAGRLAEREDQRRLRGRGDWRKTWWKVQRRAVKVLR